MTNKKDSETKVGISINGGKEVQTTVGAIEDMANIGKKMKVETLFLRTLFTPEELVDIAKQTAAKIRERTNLDNDRKRVAADFKAKMDTLDSELGKLSSDYDSGYEMRQIKCDVFVDFVDNKKRWVRQDDGTTAQEKKLTMEDMQMEFPTNKDNGEK